MARISPNRKPLDELGAITMPYAPDGAEPVDVAQVVQGLEAEYTALRNTCVLIDQPTRGTLEITGTEHLEFLNNMLTQELKGFAPGQTRRSFWLSRKGRVEADLRLIATEGRLWVDVDAHRAAHAAATLSEFIFAEDIAIADRTENMHRISLHGPRALDVLKLPDLAPDTAVETTIAGAIVICDRYDTTGEMGVELLVSAADAAIVFGALRDAGSPLGMKVAGWHAWNIARIEAGTPVYYLDFGPDSIPQETGCFEDRVSLTKGCYLGQEVVARLHSLGKPKQKLIGLDFTGNHHPMTGDLLYAEGNDDKPVGAITSATISPKKNEQPIAFAQLKTAHTTPGTQLILHTGDGPMPATVRDSLSFCKTIRMPRRTAGRVVSRAPQLKSPSSRSTPAGRIIASTIARAISRFDSIRSNASRSRTLVPTLRGVSRRISALDSPSSRSTSHIRSGRSAENRRRFITVPSSRSVEYRTRSRKRRAAMCGWSPSVTLSSARSSSGAFSSSIVHAPGAPSVHAVASVASASASRSNRSRAGSRRSGASSSCFSTR